MAAGVTDSILEQYGMKWKCNPYRIINKYGVRVQKHTFDLRQSTLKAQENLGKERAIFKKTSPSTLEK